MAAYRRRGQRITCLGAVIVADHLHLLDSCLLTRIGALILACSHGSVHQDCAAHGEIKVDDGVARLAAAAFFVV